MWSAGFPAAASRSTLARSTVLRSADRPLRRPAQKSMPDSVFWPSVGPVFWPPRYPECRAFDHLAEIAAAAAVIDQAIRQHLTEQARIKCFAIVLCAGEEPINHFRTVPAQPRRTARLELFQRSDQGFSGHQ